MIKEFVGDLRPLRKDILVHRMEGGFRVTDKGVVLPDDIRLKEDYIKPRWAQVWKVGEEVDFVKPGQWVLVEHGYWTRRVRIKNRDGEFLVQKIHPDHILLVADEKDFTPPKTTEWWHEIDDLLNEANFSG